MRLIPRFGTLLHLLRAGLLGGFTLLILGTVMVAAEHQKNRPSGPRLTEAAPPATSQGDTATVESGPEVIGMRRHVFQMSVLGAIVGIFTALLLMVFPVGPTTKVVFGMLCGPVLPMLLFVPATAGVDDAGGMVLLGAAVGLLVGLLEASRVARKRRVAPQAEL